MNYDSWKATNPADNELGPEPVKVPDCCSPMGHAWTREQGEDRLLVCEHCGEVAP